MEAVQVKLEVFEGPLDLLIALIGKHKIEIWDIHISEILEQYLAYLDQMRRMDLEVTSDFIAMASNLMYIKSRMLLPAANPPEEEDPRLSLVQALMEYQRHKLSCAVLRERLERFEGYFVKEPEPLPMERVKYEEKHDPMELFLAHQRILDKNNRKLPPPVKAFTGIVGKEQVPVSKRISYVLRQLVTKRMVRFLDLLRSARSRSEIVATFLAVLELTKNKRVLVDTGEGSHPEEFTIKIGKNGENEHGTTTN